MLRTHEYTFKPGSTKVRKDEATGASSRIRVFARQLIVSSRGAGTLTVRDSGESHPDSPHEFRIPYGPGSYTLDLAFAWPTDGYQVLNDALPDADGCKHPVTVTLVRSDDPTQPETYQVTIPALATGGLVTRFGAAHATPDDVSVVYLKISSESPNEVGYDFSATPKYAGSPKLYPGEALPPLDVRRGLTVSFCAGVGLTSLLEVVKVFR